jgi:OOP family OmpA-OmpF porin
MRARVSLIFIILTLCVATNLFAQEDHPLIGRLEGSELWHQNLNKIHEYTVITGPIKDGKIDSKIELVGNATLTQYRNAGDNSTFGIHHNYKEFLKNKGFDILFSCGKGKCGDGFSEKFWELNPVVGNDDALGPAITMGSGSTEYYLSAKKEEADKTIYVCIFASQGWWSFPVYRIDVVESKPEKTKILTAGSIGESILSQGHISIYGIYFDTGKSEIKSESRETLTVIADYLKANLDKKFYIVGHTDNTGNFDANISLSKNRAHSVLNYLVSKSGVKAQQLKAEGVGSLSPVASNLTGDGRAKNRRVEIVAQ